MKTRVHDLQEKKSNLHGATVHNRLGLLALFQSVCNREPFVCELIGDNGYKLTVGIGKQYGFVQHSPSDGDTPYLLARASNESDENGYIEFLAGDTPTPIPNRFCLPLPQVIEIVADFVETGERFGKISWEEV